ncbi:MAG TPA: enoyl-CoA hydratase/isomerase family protein [Flavobacteriales bacterium]|jgi:methylglutaconyl-CoA hydratase|nr:enoyl-CoA hydratase/isomerase family protein [Flavobacteriales bacterium]HJN63658.1 enoyl-CoA hydratase/isomerase family protein [Flavobacteriales bacterium]
MKEFVKLNIENGIGTIEFFHPKSNSLPGDVLAELASNITTAGEDKKIKVIILKSAGEKTFCAGASFDELLAINTPENGKKFFSGFANVINAARKCPKFIIGRVQGKAVGGGIGMASATDYCFATKFASVKLSELAIGIGPFVVGPAVERKVGTSAFSAMTINSTKWFDASWAREKGLYTEVFETTEEMDIEVSKLASTLSISNPEAMDGLKKIMWEGTNHWDTLLMERAESSGKLVLSDFTKNAIEKLKSYL